MFYGCRNDMVYRYWDVITHSFYILYWMVVPYFRQSKKRNFSISVLSIVIVSHDRFIYICSLINFTLDVDKHYTGPDVLYTKKKTIHTIKCLWWYVHVCTHYLLFAYHSQNLIETTLYHWQHTLSVYVVYIIYVVCTISFAQNVNRKGFLIRIHWVSFGKHEFHCLKTKCIRLNSTWLRFYTLAPI